VITPVGVVKGTDTAWTIGGGTTGWVTLRLREELMGIQYGHLADRFGWVHKVC
jgi:branched-chain amino acid aminotransferase